MLSIVRWGLLVAATLAGLGTAQAQNYPERPIRLVVAFVAGGATDTLTRQITEDLKAALGQPVIVENRPGANGYIAWNYVANSEPDGYTLLMAENALAISQGLFKKSASSFDPLKQYDAVAQVATSPLALVVANKVPANTLGELIRLARTTPEKMNYASAGIGSVAHLTFEVFRDGAGIEAVHIPYKSGSEMVTAVLGEQVQMSFPDVSILIPLIREGKVKALAVSSPQRHPQLPDVPTMVESGIADFILTFWSGVVAPAGTPAPVIERLNAAINQGLRSPEIGQTLAGVGAQTTPGSPQDFGNFIVSETAKWSAVAKTAGIGQE